MNHTKLRLTGNQQTFPLDAVVAGYLGVDIAPGFPAGRPAIPAVELFRPGRLIETKGLDFSLGGVVANTGLAMKRFGRQVELMGCVGCDALGDIVTAQLTAHGVASGIRKHPRVGTAYGIVIAPPGMDRIFFEDPGCNAVFTAKDIDYQTVARSRLFHFGYPPLMEKLWVRHGAELAKLFKQVRGLGVATSLDMTLPDADSPAGRADWGMILANTLPFVDIFMPSIEEILFMLEPDQYACLLAGADGRDMVDVIPRAVYDGLADRILELGVPCKTWDNATLLCEVVDPADGFHFPWVLKTQRIAPGQKDTWYAEIIGTKACARWSSANPNVLQLLEYTGGEQSYRAVETGYNPAYQTITGANFEFGFTDAILQMWAAFLHELATGSTPSKFAGCATPAEAHLSHRLFTAALESAATGATRPVSAP